MLFGKINLLFAVPILLILSMLVSWFIYYLHRSDQASPLDLITSPDNGRLSAAKIGQLVGMIVASWIVITANAAGRLTYEMFFLYLAYVGGVDGYSKYLRFRQRKDPCEDKDGKNKDVIE